VPRTTNHAPRCDRGDRDEAAEAAVLPHERLEVYGLALQLHAAAITLVPKKGCHELKDQIERAATSVVLNIAEGAGRYLPRDKRRFFEIARGSATEIAAVVDILTLRGAAPVERCLRARNLAVRVVQMLSKLSARLR
jgi:four helix bundle protein